MEAQLALIVIESRVKLMRAIGCHCDLMTITTCFASFAEGRHHLMAILT